MRRPAKKYTYEIYLSSKTPSQDDWQKWLRLVRHFVGLHRRIQIELRQEHATLHYYLLSPKPLPLNLGSAHFLLGSSKVLQPLTAQPKTGPYTNHTTESYAGLGRQLKRRQRTLVALELDFHPGVNFAGRAMIYYRDGVSSDLKQQRLLFFNPLSLLAINFAAEPDLCYKKIPKYLKIDKSLSLLQPASDSGIFHIDTFPYTDRNATLRLGDYDFAKHSLVIGGSGSGKSKFLALLVDQIAKQDPIHTKVVIVDPHHRLKDDLRGISSQQVIDFRTLESSIDLFCNHATDINASVELMLELFRLLISEGYNGKTERVLRFSTYLLLAQGDFSFLSLRRLLSDLDYRNQTIAIAHDRVPTSITHFFLTDFNELKTQSYSEAIAPILAFIDEMQMIPVFSELTSLPGLKEVVQQNFLSIFSLSSLSLGRNVTRTIAGLLFQQLFMLAQSQPEDQQLIIIVDEVAVVENPILARFLSELRKYHTSLILAGQYFEQISPSLGAAILANTSNYYLFRTSKVDAKLFIENLEIKTQDSAEDAERFLTGLKTQECLVRVAKGETLYPIMKARTFDLEVQQPSLVTDAQDANVTTSPSSNITSVSISQTASIFEAYSTTPESTIASEETVAQVTEQVASTHVVFDIGGVSFDEIMQSLSTGRKGEEDD